MVALNISKPTRRPPPQVRREYRANAACSISRRQALPVEDVESSNGVEHTAGARNPQYATEPLQRSGSVAYCGAGDGNRTHVTSLEGWRKCSDINH